MSSRAVLCFAWLLLFIPGLLGQTGTTAGTPFQQNSSLNLAAGSGVSFIFYDVPVGKRLVLDYVSAWADVKLGEQLKFVIQTTVESNIVDYRLVHSALDNGDGTVSLTANQAMRICADGGTRVVLQQPDQHSSHSGSLGRHAWFAGSPKLGVVQAMSVMRTLQIGDRPTKLAQAVAEVGRIDKTIHCLTYIDDETHSAARSPN